MFLNPKKAIDEGWITGLKDDKQIQPNAVDITADRMFQVLDSNVFEVSNTDKLHRNRGELTNPHFWQLERGVYDFLSDVYVDVPEGAVGWLVTRSTLNRNGLIVQSGLYDSGFKGNIGGMLYNLSGMARITPHTCVAQFILADSESVGKYSGGYNTERGALPGQFAGGSNE